MKKITKKQFLADVMHEIEMLKLNAAPQEKSRLNFSEFDPESKTECIYGQMTGNCSSDRAFELIDLCCIRVVRNTGTMDEFSNILPNVNGEYNADEFKKTRKSLQYISSLEGYIFAEGAKNKRVIQYIKGEIDTLSL